jgi:hypothetical protein
MAERKQRESTGYRRVLWNNQFERFECESCPYDTDDEQAMREHQAQPSHQE